jgi:hypothetical protein
VAAALEAARRVEKVAAAPEAAWALVGQAGRLGLAELAEECARAKAATVDLEARREAVRAARGLRSYTDSAGAWRLSAQGLPEHGAQAMAVLGVVADERFPAARREGRRDRPEAYLYDAFMAVVALATGPGGAGEAGGPGEADGAGDSQGTAPPPITGATRAKLRRLRPSFSARADLGALLRGYPVAGEVCQIAGFGPISTQAAVDLLGTHDPFLKAIVTDGQKVTGVAHLRRCPTAHQRSALDWLYPNGAAEGCATGAGRLQSDHRADWAQAHVTIFDLLDRLCPLRHGLKTRSGWALVAGRGKRAFVPPEGPRHPGHHGGRAQVGARAPVGSGAGPPPA